MKNWLKLGFQQKPYSKRGKDIPFVATYHPILQALDDIIKGNLNWLYAGNEVKNLFSPGHMVSFRGARKLSSYFVRAKVYPLEHKVRSCHCSKKWCQVCLNVTETSSFTSTSTNKASKINHLFNCTEKCIVYLLIVGYVLSSIQAKLWMSSKIGGTTINSLIENNQTALLSRAHF